MASIAGYSKEAQDVAVVIDSLPADLRQIILDIVCKIAGTDRRLRGEAAHTHARGRRR